MRRTSDAGRAGLWVLVAVALAALAFLWFADPLGLFGAAGERETGAGSGNELEGTRPGAGAAAAPLDTGVSLAGLYGEGDRGSVRLRLLDAATKKPRAALPVTLRSRKGVDTVLPTGPDGVALFPMVMPGRGFQVLITGDGFRAVTLEGVAVQPKFTTDLGDIWLGKNVVLRGRVLDPTGKPVPQASVAVYSPQPGVASRGMLVFLVEQALSVPTPKEQVATDDGGWFAFTSLNDGTYSLVARRPGFGMRQQDDVVVSARSGSSPLVVRLGEGARMSGRVLDADGKPVVGARVVGLRDFGPRPSFSGTLERDEGLSDAKGQYALDTLVDGGTYRFGVMAEGFAAAWDQARTEMTKQLERDFTLAKGGFLEGRVMEAGTGTPVADASVTVIVGRINFGGMGGGRGGRGAASQGGGGAPADPTTPALTRTDAQGRFRVGPLLPGPVMSGIVKASGFASFSASTWTGNAWPDVTLDGPAEVAVTLERGGRIEGMVRTAEGQPIPGATLIAAGGGMLGMGAMFSGSPNAETDTEGRYRMDGVPPGDYHLAASAPGYAQAEAGDAATKATIPPEGGAVTLDLTLSAAGVITGVVVDAKGEPVAGARVRTRPSLGNMFGGGGGARGGAGGSGGGAGGIPTGAGARLLAALNTAVDLTDAQGQFRLEGVGTAVDWTVEADAEDFVPVSSEKLRLKAGELRELKLVLVGGATLAGTVTGEGGARVAGARIRVGTLDPDEAARPFLSAWQADRLLDPRVFVSDDEGRFVIPNIKPGRVAVKAEHKDWVTFFKRNLSLEADAVLEHYAIVLPRGEVAEGVVKGADGRPLEDARVAVTAQRSLGGSSAEGLPADSGDSVEPTMTARTDRDGKFKIENIPPGTWNVVVLFAAGHAGWFGAQDESAIVRDVQVPTHSVEFRLKAQEAGALPFAMPRPTGTGGAGAGAGGGSTGGAGTAPRPPGAPGTGGGGFPPR